MIYQDTNFKICLSLFGWKENILPKQHIVQWQKVKKFRGKFGRKETDAEKERYKEQKYKD